MSAYFRLSAVAALIVAANTGLCYCADAPATPPLTRQELAALARDQTAHNGDSPDNPGPLAADLSADLNSVAVKKAIHLVAQWQLARAEANFNQQWTYGALYDGFMAASACTGDPRFRDAMVAMAESFNWDIVRGFVSAGNLAAAAAGSNDPTAGDLPAPPPPPPPGVRTPMNNDNQCVAQTYLELYFQYHAPWMLAPIRDALDPTVNIETVPVSQGRGGAGGRGGGRGGAATQPGFARAFGTVLGRNINPNHIVWWWSDSLFMSPPTWMRLYKATGDRKYLDYVDHHWWIASQNLYDPEEHLYYRDNTYIGGKELNGKKVFWSRGNGWVVGGLVRVLQYMPADYPDRAKFVTQFKEMCDRLRQLQGDDGLWRSGMLDPDAYGQPENSGSAFFCYGLAWGVNEGILDRATYEPVVAKAWAGLISHIYADGRLGCIQQTGAGPAHFKPSSSHVYGVGAFLLAGREVNRLALLKAMEDRAR